MQDINEKLDELEETEDQEEFEDTSKATVKFNCPSCGEVERENVLFLCNTCDSRELIEKEGIYMCPSCLVPGDNFECLDCGSTHVEMTVLE